LSGFQTFIIAFGSGLVLFPSMLYVFMSLCLDTLTLQCFWFVVADVFKQFSVVNLAQTLKQLSSAADYCQEWPLDVSTKTQMALHCN